MPEQQQWVSTVKDKEIIFPYGDTGPLEPGDSKELSQDANVSVQILFDQGNRKLVVVENGVTKKYNLRSPKKPENTGTPLFVGPYKGMVSAEIAEVLRQQFKLE